MREMIVTKVKDFSWRQTAFVCMQAQTASSLLFQWTSLCWGQCTDTQEQETQYPPNEPVWQIRVLTYKVIFHRWTRLALPVWGRLSFSISIFFFFYHLAVKWGGKLQIQNLACLARYMHELSPVVSKESNEDAWPCFGSCRDKRHYYGE